MIQTSRSTFDRYSNLHPGFDVAWAALKKMAAEPFVPGRYEVDGDNIYIVATEYNTKPEADALMEAHRRYIDIMLLLNGEEIIGYQPVESLSEITSEFDAAADALLGKMDPQCTKLKMLPGDMTVFFPEDAHAPCMHLSGPCSVRKLIAKVRV